MMRSRDIMILLTLGLFAIVNSRKNFVPYLRDDPPDPKATCVLRQQCYRTEEQPMSETNCPGGPIPTNINNPQIEYFEPSPLLKPESV